ncbi:acyltransferase [Halothiobacillus neapolitanus]|uniref:Acetyltransferase (Isoleucine patch superfamily)-like protein n=1 Tax=Halothiobacillus neapolitanus (strain ATCC 23641 / DSM 15147 / CIP 104769 / NCIMB 8539 / c2) TaxID=555778 RepID=D0KX88_HALNC|nr:acyltransferase [Halothiobacillus neapolitanus]ACX95102.1 Acetyltransferase (isoleucine patch superfamily)-like protein [Halothiobacillus neapolitanus c2]TDN60944.1 putative colanic acid biosynthesis acetyltransferase WcaF [Halothiobacillus neapolitanus]
MTLKAVEMTLNTLGCIAIRNAMHPKLRSWLLRLFGANVGINVRIHSCRFMNFELGFKNLKFDDGVYIGTDVLIDCACTLNIGKNTTISARSALITHSDPGTRQGNAIAKIYPARKTGVFIGNDCWIGVGAIVLDGSVINDRCLVAAGSVVTGSTLDKESLYAGSPAVFKKKLNFNSEKSSSHSL